MQKRPKARDTGNSQIDILKGWKEIANSLGEPVSVVKRWKSVGMPVSEEGRYVSSTSEQLTKWLGRESGKPVHVVTPETDLTSELKRGIAFARHHKKSGGR